MPTVYLSLVCFVALHSTHCTLRCSYFYFVVSKTFVVLCCCMHSKESIDLNVNWVNYQHKLASLSQAGEAQEFRHIYYYTRLAMYYCMYASNICNAYTPQIKGKCHCINVVLHWLWNVNKVYTLISVHTSVA